MNPLNDDGSWGESEFIELDNPELETADLSTYIKHAATLLERPVNDYNHLDRLSALASNRPVRTNSPLDVERLEIVLDYLYAELNRRINGKQA